MTKGRNNMYRTCRLKAAERDDRFGTVENAADVLNLSTRSLYNYELFTTRPPVETVVLMAEKYRTPELLIYYCANECPIGRARGLEAPEDSGLFRATITAITRLRDAETITEQILEVAEDGQVTPDEQETLEGVIEWISDLTEVSEQLKQILAEVE